MSETRFTVVHTDAAPNGDWSIESEMLAGAGARFVPTRAASEDELIANTRDADALVVGLANVTRRVINALTRAKVIVRYGVGYDSVDIPAATERGIPVCNVPDYCTEEVANHALALLLAVNRRIVQQDAAIRAGGWRGMVAPMGALAGETAGIIGYGRIGRAMAKRCRALGMTVLAADPYAGAPDADDRIVPLDELLERADYISIHCLLNEETRALVNEQSLRKMKPNAILVNTARGPIVDQRALARALTEGWIAGAGLDVMEIEPAAAEEPLRKLANVVLTPHTAYYSDPAGIRLKQRVAEAVIAALRGERPPHVLNPDVWKG
jgi:D-3-phosphoglycerate dehydrogenase